MFTHIKGKKIMLYHSISILLCIFLFTLDIVFPLGYEACAFYVVVIIVINQLANNKAIYTYAILCSVLTILGFFDSETEKIYYIAILDRIVFFICSLVDSNILHKNK